MARRNVFPRIPTREQIRANLVGKLSDRLHPIEQARRFRSNEHFTSCLDLIANMYTPWCKGTLKLHDSDRKYDIWVRDSLAVLQELIGDVTIGHKMKWAPVKEFDSDHNRIYGEMCSANWWWDMQLELHPDETVPEGGSRTVIPLILSADKTVYGSLSGMRMHGLCICR